MAWDLDVQLVQATVAECEQVEHLLVVFPNPVQPGLVDAFTGKLNVLSKRCAADIVPISKLRNQKRESLSRKSVHVGSEVGATAV